MKKILVIDNYDSFTFNLVHYLEDLEAEVTVFRNDTFDLEEILPFDKIVLSPKKPTGEPYIFAKNIQLPPRLYCDNSNNKIYTPKNPNADKKKRASVFCLA